MNDNLESAQEELNEYYSSNTSLSLTEWLENNRKQYLNKPTMTQHIKVWRDEEDNDPFVSWLLYLMKDANIVTVIPRKYSPKSNVLSEALVIYTLK